MDKLQAIHPRRRFYISYGLTYPSPGISKFQGYLDSLTNTPLETTELEKANTLLAGVDSVRYQVAIFNFGLQTINQPTLPAMTSRHILLLLLLLLKLSLNLFKSIENR